MKGAVYNGKESDVFSAGVVLFALAKGTFPFNQANGNDELYNLIRTGKFDEYWARLDKEKSLSNEFKKLVFSMLAEEGTDRPTVEQIRAHSWF